MKIGLLFGSFNPIHVGHLSIGQYMINDGFVDKIWFVVSPQNPFKSQTDLLSAEHRCAMVKAAIKDNTGFALCDVELSLPVPSYTIDTMHFLQSSHPEVKFSIIMGADNAVSLHKWKNGDELIQNFEILVYPRPGFECKDAQNKRFIITKAPQMDISSTLIRDNIHKNKSIKYLTREEVISYIHDHRLYN